jgi:Toprim domain-containing protein
LQEKFEDGSNRSAQTYRSHERGSQQRDRRKKGDVRQIRPQIFWWTSRGQAAQILSMEMSLRRCAATQAEAYLRARGLDIPTDAPLRFLPSVSNRDKMKFPAMVGKISLPDGEFCAVHLTFLDRDGAPRKANIQSPREFRGPLGKGAIWLTPPCDCMVIGEGIESVLSLWMVVKSLGAVAATNDNYSRILLPDNVQDIIIAVDVDVPDGKGRRAGEAGARRAAEEWLQ